MLQIPEIVKKTKEMFDLFNEHFYNFYNKKLTRPAITVSPDGGRGADGNVMNLTTENDAFYQETKQRAGEYFDKLDALGLPKEAKLLIDRYVNENMANVSRYEELAYNFAKLYPFVRQMIP